MPVKTIFLILLVLNGIPAAQAKLEVYSKGVRYTLALGKKKLSLTGRRHHLSLERTKCNGEIIRQFEDDIKTLLNRLSRIKRPSRSLWYYVAEGKKVFVDYRSSDEKALLLVPGEFHRLKLQNKYLCEKG